MTEPDPPKAVDSDFDYPFDTPQERVERLAALFDAWEEFRNASTAIDQAFTLGPFTNQFFHFQSEVEREWVRDGLREPSEFA